MIKFSFFVVIVLLLNQSVLAQNNSFTIKGTIKGLDVEEMLVFIVDLEAPNGYRSETIKVENESFEFLSTIKDPTYVTISTKVDRVKKRVGRGFIPVNSSLLAVFAYPGASIEVEGEITDFVNAYPKGDELNNGLAELNRIIYPVMNEAANYSVKASTLEGELKEEAERKGTEISKQVLQLKEKFIAENKDEMASVWLLSDMALRNQLPMERIEELFNALTPKYSQTGYYKEINKRVKGYKATKTGELAPEIVTSKTNDGTAFDLKSLRGKYVVIDFWGTWCRPCIDGIPKLREYWKKYEGKLYVVGIAQDSNVETWKKVIAQHNIDWYNIINDRKDEDFVVKYSVSGFPTKILIDPKGKIIGRWVGEGEAGEGLYQKLDELFADK